MLTISRSVLTFGLILSAGCHRYMFAQDYGDAPDPLYPTLAASNGAVHLAPTLFLGTRVDVEMNGQPWAGADGDDNMGGADDEDGVVFSTWLVPGQSATLVITASAPGNLDAWMDFNFNGSWLDAGDQVFSSQALVAGPNTLSFSVPVSVPPGARSYARFRFSSAGGLTPSGPAPDGEVEDYEIVFGLPPSGCIVMEPDAGLSNTQNEISMTTENVSGNLVAAYNDQPYPGGTGLGISYSTDNGATWNSLQLAAPTNPYAGVPMVDAFDPAITSDASGNVYAAHIATDFNWSAGPVSGLFVHKSVNGGISWSAPVTVAADSAAVSSPDPNYRFNDRCQITCDLNPSSPYYNRVYVTWIKDRGWNMPQPYSDIYFAWSSDGGGTFSTPVIINSVSNNMGNMPVPAVAADGKVFVAWIDYNVITGGSGILMIDSSADGGTTWGTDIAVDTLALPPINLNGGSDARAKGAAVLRAHPSNSAELYLVYAEDPDGAGPDETDIFFIRSVNSGVAWSSPLRINDDATTTDQVMPWMEINPNGTINVAWYDRRNDAGDLLWEVYVTYSTDSGQSFSANSVVSCQNFPTPNTMSGRWMGEYLGMTIKDTIVYLAYTSSLLDPEGDIFHAFFFNPSLGEDVKPQPGAFFDIRIFPNPASDKLHLQLPDAGPAEKFTVAIYNVTGSLACLQEITGTAEIDVRSFPPGLYMLYVTDGQLRTAIKRFARN